MQIHGLTLFQKKTFNRVVCRYYDTIKGFGWIEPKPSAHIIPPDVGVTTMCLLRASSVRRQWYGLMPPAIMIFGKHDVSGGTEAKMRGAKVS